MALVVKRFLQFALLIVVLAFMWSCAPESKSSETASTEVKPAPPEPAPPAPIDHALDNGRPIVAAFGDSLSAGFGADPGKSYPDYLQKLLDHNGFKYKVMNAGVSGDTTTDGVERMRPVIATKPKIVVLELGGNDGLRGLPIETTKANLEQMILAFQAAGSKVVLAGMTLPRNYGPEYIHAFEQMYVELAKKYRLTRIPFLLTGVAQQAGLMQPDGIHPTAEGNEKVAQTVFEAIRPLLRVS